MMNNQRPENGNNFICTHAGIDDRKLVPISLVCRTDRTGASIFARNFASDRAAVLSCDLERTFDKALPRGTLPNRFQPHRRSSRRQRDVYREPSVTSPRIVRRLLGHVFSNQPVAAEIGFAANSRPDPNYLRSTMRETPSAYC